MHSIRNAIAVTCLLVAAAGCQNVHTSPTEALNPAPIVEDEAMAIRDWEPSTALYACGYSWSYPTLFPWRPADNLGIAEQFVWPAALQLGQIAVAPIAVFWAPAWKLDVYHGVVFPPTQSAVVPVAGDQQHIEN